MGDGRLEDDSDWDLGDLPTCATLEPCSARKSDFDPLCIACEQASVAKLATLADIVAAAQEGLNLQAILPLQVALVKLQVEKVPAFSAWCTSLEGTITECN